MSIQRAAIAKLVKVRSRGRKVYYFSGDPVGKKPESAAGQLSASGLRPPLIPAATTEAKPRPTEFRFMPSDRYRLTRVPPEEEAAIRKKLEEKEH